MSILHRSERGSYHAARQRCVNRRDARYADYGGRGIEFRFKSFLEFFAVLGPRPAGLVLDRKDNEGHYEAGNVRWTTRSESQRNQRKRRFVPWSKARRFACWKRWHSKAI